MRQRAAQKSASQNLLPNNNNNKKNYSPDWLLTETGREPGQEEEGVDGQDPPEEGEAGHLRGRRRGPGGAARGTSSSSSSFSPRPHCEGTHSTHVSPGIAHRPPKFFFCNTDARTHFLVSLSLSLSFFLSLVVFLHHVPFFVCVSLSFFGCSVHCFLWTSALMTWVWALLPLPLPLSHTVLLPLLPPPPPPKRDRFGKRRKEGRKGAFSL